MMRFSMLSELASKVAGFGRGLRNNQRGAVTPMFLVSAGLVFGVSLGAIDLIRYTTAKSRLQAALDNSALAAGQLASVQGTSDMAALTAEAQAYFDANFPEGYLGSGLRGGTVSLQLGEGGGTLAATVDAALPLISTGFMDVSSLNMASAAVVELPGVSAIEVVFAIDKGANPAGSKNNNGNGNKKFDSMAAVSTAQDLAELLMLDEDLAVPGASVGLVPFSEVVNVGEAGRPWVARWLESWSSDSAYDGRLRDTNKDYTDQVWRGCIAEPEPWNKPDSFGVLSPSARFQPVFMRVVTELNTHNGQQHLKYKWSQLPLTNAKAAFVAPDYEPKDPMTLLPNGGAQYDRRLWAEFGGFEAQGNKTNAAVLVFGAYEPETCAEPNRVRFLTNDANAVTTALSAVASEPEQGETLYSAGLLWSWRMLHPNWRGSEGWDDSALEVIGDGPPAKTIVLFASGAPADWDDVNVVPSPPIHKSDNLWDRNNNSFAFKLDYLGEVCEGKNKNLKCYDPIEVSHVQPPFVPPVKPGNIPKKDWYYWQYPATSLLMPNPYKYDQNRAEDDLNPDTTGWPAMSTYTAEVCNAIKQDGIKILVVDLNGAGDPALKACSSDNRLYSPDELEAVRNAIAQNISSGGKLRLIR